MGELVVPRAVLALWALLILVIVPLLRVRAVLQKRVSQKVFLCGESAAVPGDVALPNRDSMNLLERPALLYVACLAVLASNRTDEPMWALA